MTLHETDDSTSRENVAIETGSVVLPGILAIPPQAAGVVLFAHGSGSGRLSPRNQAVDQTLQGGGLATLLVDLLAEAESMDRGLVFDINLLASRLSICTTWLTTAHGVELPIGYFGESTGAGVFA